MSDQLRSIQDLEDEVYIAGRHLRQIYIHEQAYESWHDPSPVTYYTVGLRHGRKQPDIKLYEIAIELPTDPALADTAKRDLLEVVLRQIRERFQVRWEGASE